MLMLGGPSPELLAPIYDEFLRWKGLLEAEFRATQLSKIL